MIDVKKLLTKILVTLKGKQNTLISGTNIKTINNTSLLGSGNITTPNTNTTYSILRNTHTSPNQTQASSSQSIHTFNITKPSEYNYTYGIVGIRLTGEGVGRLVPYSWYISGSSADGYKVNVGIRNNHSTDTITFTIEAQLLWFKTN